MPTKAHPFDDARKIIADYQRFVDLFNEAGFPEGDIEIRACDLARIFEYVHALEKENSSLVGIAWVHGMYPPENNDVNAEASPDAL